MYSKKNIRLALYGMGAAGEARRRAAEEMEGVTLAAIVSRRPELKTPSLADVLADPEIDALAVSTENSDHPETVARSLAAGKHVLCDFPLAFSETEGRRLFQLAREKNRVLHVEHLALLAADHRELKAEINAKGGIKRGEYLFQAGWTSKLVDPARTGPYAFLCVSRLLQVADLFGAFEMESGECRLEPKGLRIHLHLRFPSGGVLGFTEQRVEGLPRRRTLQAKLERGSLSWKSKPGAEGLFGKDLEWFRDRVREGKGCYYDEEVMLKILGILERVGAVPPPTRHLEGIQDRRLPKGF